MTKEQYHDLRRESDALDREIEALRLAQALIAGTLAEKIEACGDIQKALDEAEEEIGF